MNKRELEALARAEIQKRQPQMTEDNKIALARVAIAAIGDNPEGIIAFIADMLPVEPDKAKGNSNE